MGVIEETPFMSWQRSAIKKVNDWALRFRFTFKKFLAQQDVYEGEPSETQDDHNEIDGSFEVVPGVTADEYVKRFSTIEISNPTDRRNFRIRVPPAPETFYDIGK